MSNDVVEEPKTEPVDKETGKIEKRLLIKLLDATINDITAGLQEIRNNLKRLHREEIESVTRIQQLHEFKQIILGQVIIDDIHLNSSD